MPAINCKCGNLLRYGNIPNPIEWLIISDVEYDNYVGSINAEELYKNMKHLLQCKKCDRIFFYPEGFDKKPKIYVLEN